MYQYFTFVCMWLQLASKAASSGIGSNVGLPAVVDWLQSLPAFVDQLHQFTSDIITADRLTSRCDEYLSLLLCIQRRVDGEVVLHVSQETAENSGGSSPLP